MKSIAELMIKGALGNKENPYYYRVLKRYEMFKIIEDCDFEERCEIVDNLLSTLKMDCDYKTCEDLAIGELDYNWEQLKEEVEKARNQVKEILNKEPNNNNRTSLINFGGWQAYDNVLEIIEKIEKDEED